MTMNYVYRVQDSKGRGPWRPGFSQKWRDQARDIPDPFYIEFPDIDLSRGTGNFNFGCGCVSIDQLKKWFSQDEYNRLLKLGYKAVKLKADRIIKESKNQVVFSRNKSFRKDAVRITLYDCIEGQAND